MHSKRYLPDIEQWSQSSGSNVIPRRARPDLALTALLHGLFTSLSPPWPSVERVSRSCWWVCWTLLTSWTHVGHRRLKKYQYLLYKHVLLHGLNASVAVRATALGSRPYFRSANERRGNNIRYVKDFRIENGSSQRQNLALTG